MGTNLTSIIADLEQQRDAIDRALAALQEVGGAVSAAPAKRRGRPRKDAIVRTGAATAAKKRVLSPEGRRRIIEATKRRWAAAKKAQQKQTPKKRGGMTAAGRKRLSELMKARWASKNPPKPVARNNAAA